MFRSGHARAAFFASATTLVLAAAVACTTFSSDNAVNGALDAAPDVAPDAQEVDAAAAPDGAVVPKEKCDSQSPFDRVEAVTSDDAQKPINTAKAHERGTTLSSDERTLYFHRELNGNSSIHVATRTTATGPFAQVFLAPLSENGMHYDANPQLSADGMLLYFDSDRTSNAGGLFAHTLWRFVLAGGPTAAPVQLNIQSPVAEPFVRDDELFYSQTPLNGAYVIAVTNAAGTRAGMPLSTSVNPGNGQPSTHPVLSADGLDLYFARRVSDGVNFRIHRATRAAVGQPFGSAVALPSAGIPLGPTMNSTDESAQSPLWISRDNCRLYFEKTPLPTEQYDLFVAIRKPKPKR